MADSWQPYGTRVSTSWSTTSKRRWERTLHIQWLIRPRPGAGEWRRFLGSISIACPSSSAETIQASSSSTSRIAFHTCLPKRPSRLIYSAMVTYWESSTLRSMCQEVAKPFWSNFGQSCSIRSSLSRQPSYAFNCLQTWPKLYRSYARSID